MEQTSVRGATKHTEVVLVDNDVPPADEGDDARQECQDRHHENCMQETHLEGSVQVLNHRT